MNIYINMCITTCAASFGDGVDHARAHSISRSDSTSARTHASFWTCKRRSYIYIYIYICICICICMYIYKNTTLYL